MLFLKCINDSYTKTLWFWIKKGIIASEQHKPVKGYTILNGAFF